ncbi:PepSY domain-containing protein [Clostridium algidicarnis]|uniref:Peptidase YpeB-like protein n=2 Tax=Clostridium algidicarnis TaxID=37659 RepID=A0A2S6G0E1_9CLOT|nr:PepSY domain-containing protein [Clostridium algidicarnis]MBU3220274.1 PepSY domain-containing protein [Clostridium algidicarnis]MCB2286765.1 PepSY domain-containing protein [Clostridium algidicarnis]PPK49392.1 peptidase YpeB-like protein [Clostridium algidicarnis DSM 15099]
MKNIFVQLKEFFKTYKKRIITVISISLLAVVIVAGISGMVVYSKLKANLKYSQEDLQKIALVKVPGEVIKVEKELNIEEAVYEYKFKIKDKENMLQIVKLDSESGAILKVHNQKDKGENKNRDGKNNNQHGE